MYDAEPGLSLGVYSGGLDRLLAGLQALTVPGGVLELDGAPTDELADAIEGLSLDDPELVDRNRRARNAGRRLGPLRFGGGPLSVPLRPETIARLREIARPYPTGYIAVGLRVLDEEGVALAVPDIGSTEVFVRRDFPAPAIEALRTALADELDAEVG